MTLENCTGYLTGLRDPAKLRPCQLPTSEMNEKNKRSGYHWISQHVSSKVAKILPWDSLIAYNQTN